MQAAIRILGQRINRIDFGDTTEFASMTHFIEYVVSILGRMFMSRCDFASLVVSYGAHYVLYIHMYISLYFLIKVEISAYLYCAVL